nr:reverse transcriptase domain-containing protein [Tanacetum cinerariifolium]
RVLLFNSRLKIFSGKLKTRWSGPFTITKVFPYGTVELSQANGPNFKVNGHRVKHYLGGDVPQLDIVFEIKDAFGNKQYKPEDIQELFCKLFNDVQNIHEELAEYINTPGWNHPAFYNNGDDDDVDYTIAITPILSTKEPDNSLNMGDEHLDTIMRTESDEVIKSRTSDDDSLYNENIEYVEASPHDSELVGLEVAEIIIPKDEEIEDDNLRKKLLNVHLLIANIEALKDNPTPSSEFLTKSSSTSPKSFLEETNTFDNSLSEFISSGNTTTHSDISLSEYDSFIFDLSNDQFPPTDRSDFIHEEFTDELTHIISPPKYDCFYFRNLPDLGEWISILNSEIRENLSSTNRVNLPVEDDHSPLLAYVSNGDVVFLLLPHGPMNSGLSRACDSVNKNKYSHKCEDSCQRILSSKSSFPQLQLGIILLHLAGSQPMLKSSYKAKASVIISIPPLIGGVADVVVEIKGNDIYYDYSNK